LKKNIFIIGAIAVTAWVFFHHTPANWQGELAPDEPIQVSAQLPPPWTYKSFTFIAKAKYHMKAVVLSKHHYWGFGNECALSSYDLALGWGPMSDAKILNRLNIFQMGRWYFYRWSHSPPADPFVMSSHSSNNHIITDNEDVLNAVRHFKRYDVVDLEGYLVDIQSNKENWYWDTSLSRTDTGDGSCEVFWVNSAFSPQ
jgi:hypothetical protein